MRQVIKDVKDDEVDHYLRVSPVFAMHKIIDQGRQIWLDNYLRA